MHSKTLTLFFSAKQQQVKVQAAPQMGTCEVQCAGMVATSDVPTAATTTAINGHRAGTKQSSPVAVEPPPPPLKIMDFDEFLPHVGEIGRYQYILFIVMTPFCFFFAFIYFGQMFITLVPEKHWCHVPELDVYNLTETERQV